MKRLAILGSTGSIGTQALDVVRMHPDMFAVDVLVAGNNAELLAKQAIEFKPRLVVIANEQKRDVVSNMLSGTNIEVAAGDLAVCEAAAYQSTDVVLVALVGFSGLRPTKCAIDAGKTIALANKETLVVAGEYIMAHAKQKGVDILPVDSEHSAIFQCLNGERHLKPAQIILTASGGPFRGRTRAELEHVTPAAALKHPNWSMGAKVTIDSASMMNKGLESIEARWLFDMTADKIGIVVHPQSIVHSLVEFTDGSLKAQIGVPDMRLPIQYALTFPDRVPSPVAKFNFIEHPEWTFEAPDRNVFRNINIAFDAMTTGGTAPCAMNGANEVAVAEFLKGNVGFLQMSDIIEQTMEKINFVANPSFDDYFAIDTEAKRIAAEIIKRAKK